MKFGEQMKKTLIQEWGHFYINYELLKDTLDAAVEKHQLKSFAKKFKSLQFLLNPVSFPLLEKSLNPEDKL